METTEKIVEAYVRYINGWFTIPNIKCDGQYEIDLLAIDATDKNNVRRFHIESGVSISGAFSALTNKPYSNESLKERVQQASQRRTLGYFTERKFGHSSVQKKLRSYGFMPGNYAKIIVTWKWDADVPEAARMVGIELWDFRSILKEIAKATATDRTYFTDDTMRTLQLMARAIE